MKGETLCAVGREKLTPEREDLATLQHRTARMMPAMDIVLSRASPRPLLHLLGRGAPEYRAQRLHHGYAGPAVSRRRRLLSAVAIQSSARQLSTGWGLWGILDAVQGRKMVGKDAHGNTYWEVANPGGKLDPYTKIPTDPKREIEYFENELVSAQPSLHRF